MIGKESHSIPEKHIKEFPLTEVSSNKTIAMQEQKLKIKEAVS